MPHRTGKPTTQKTTRPSAHGHGGTTSASPAVQHRASEKPVSMLAAESQAMDDTPCAYPQKTEEDCIYLTPEAYDMVVAMLDKPPPLNEHMKAAIERSRALLIPDEIPPSGDKK